MLLAVKNPNSRLEGALVFDTESGIIYVRRDSGDEIRVSVLSIHHTPDNYIVYQGDAATLFWRAIMQEARTLGFWGEE